jgi:hypothetical protein
MILCLQVIKLKLDVLPSEEAADFMAAEFGPTITSISASLFKVMTPALAPDGHLDFLTSFRLL